MKPYAEVHLGNGVYALYTPSKGILLTRKNILLQEGPEVKVTIYLDPSMAIALLDFIMSLQKDNGKQP